MQFPMTWYPPGMIHEYSEEATPSFASDIHLTG